MPLDLFRSYASRLIMPPNHRAGGFPRGFRLATWLALILGLVVRAWSAEAPLTGFIAGADFSHAAFFEARGKVYREQGQARDPFQLLRSNGVQAVRMRLFASSPAQASNTPYSSINNLDYTLPLALRAKQAGLRLLLDFHYSDSWADPGKQTKPAQWTNLTFTQLEQRLEDYNRETIAALKQAGAMPDWVQVGNEITPGILWPDGRVGGSYDTPTQWGNLGRLLKAAVRGIQAAAGTTPPKIMVHIDRGGDWAGTQWFFDKLNAQQVPYDMIGLSYYPFWHGSLSDLRLCLTNAAQRYGKPLVVVETAFPWVTTNWDGTPIGQVAGITPGPQGQVQFLNALADTVAAVPGGKGAGLFWWGAEYQPLPGYNLAGFEGRSFFNYQGNALPIVAALGRRSRPTLSLWRWEPSGWVCLEATGPAGAMFDLEASTDFVTWCSLGVLTNRLGTASAVLSATNLPGSFFRVRQL